MSSDDVIDALFNRTVAIAQSLPPAGPLQTAYEEKLALYGLYKQATEGDICVPRPRLLDMLGRAKWDAWATRRGMSPRDAKQLYVEAMLRTLRRYRDRPEAGILIDELENFSGQVAEQVMHSALASSDDDFGLSGDESRAGESDAAPSDGPYRGSRRLEHAPPYGPSSDDSRELYSEEEDQHTAEARTAVSDPSRMAYSHPRPENAAGPPIHPEARLAAAAIGAIGFVNPSVARLGLDPISRPSSQPRLVPVAEHFSGSNTPGLGTEGRMYSVPGRTGAYPPSDSLAGQAAGGFRTPTGGLYRPPGAAPGPSSYSYGAPSSVGGRSAQLHRPHEMKRRSSSGPGARLPRISDSGSHHSSGAVTSQRAEAVDMALQRIQASLAGLHERMTSIERTPPRSRSGAEGSGSAGATNALAHLWRAVQNAGQDIGFLVGLSPGTGPSAPSFVAAASGARRVGHGGAANARTVRGALRNVFFSAPLRILLATLYLAGRLALDALSIGLLCTAVLLFIHRLSGRGDPLLLLRTLARGVRALRARSAAQVAALTAAAASSATAAWQELA